MSYGHIHFYCSLDDNNQEIFRATLGCNLLPSESNRLVTDPTDITLTIATKPPATTQPSTTVPNNTPTLPLIDKQFHFSIVSFHSAYFIDSNHLSTS